MRMFDIVDKLRMRYFLGVAGTTLAIVLFIIYCAGCSSTSVPEQQKFIVYSYEEAVEVGTLAKKLVTDGVIKEPNATRIENLYDRLIDAHVIYAQALLKYQENMGDKDAVTALNVAWLSVTSKATQFVNEAINLGVNWRKTK